jgi:hypothetical protein
MSLESIQTVSDCHEDDMIWSGCELATVWYAFAVALSSIGSSYCRMYYTNNRDPWNLVEL